MTSQGPSLGEPLTLRQTNVSNPSIIHSRPSQQSIAASEDYYSLSGSNASEDTAHNVSSSTHHTATVVRAGQASPLTLTRSQTPPETYRTPLHSSTHLPQHSRTNLATASTAQDAFGEQAGDDEVRKTPMHGEGKRRSSHSYNSEAEAAGASFVLGAAAAGATAATALRVGGIRRKPVPSTVMESRDSAASPASQRFIDPSAARSSVLSEIEREEGGASPGVDDTPYIRFAIDQLTRDEEVKGSRVYPDGRPYDAEPERSVASPVSTIRALNREEEEDDGRADDISSLSRDEHRDREGGAAAAGVAGAGALAAMGIAARHHGQQDQFDQRPYQQPERPMTHWPAAGQQYNAPPIPPVPPGQQAAMRPRDDDQPTNFIPVLNDGHFQPRLDFLPTILRPLWLVLFVVFLLILLALLLLCAIWSLTHKGIFYYGYLGDAKYFVFEYLPTILGMLLLYWLVQIQVAVYRIAPFIAMASETSGKSREEGALLPLTPKTFFLPYLGHFRARMPVVGFFLLSAWLQIFTIPLLASAFNVRSLQNGAPNTWRWIATAGGIWPVIGLYILLLITTSILFFWLLAQRRRISGTGVRWDPASLADLIVLLERSNALSLTEDEELRLDAPSLGYWRTSRGGNEVFQSYGVADRSARRYSLEGGRIRERVTSPTEPKSRFSDFEDDRYMGREQRHSREKMLPRQLNAGAHEAGMLAGGHAVPWFLRSFFAFLWIVIAILLLAAFLVVSYLPETAVRKGFSPMVPSLVSSLGFSGTNFLYSIVPAILAMICFLGILDIDYAYRRLQPYAALMNLNGELAERSLLLSYTADLPLAVTISALINRHWRIALLSLSSLLALAIPILAGGVFWAIFNVRSQSIRIVANMPAYYALTAFVALFGAAIIFLIFPGRAVRDLNHRLPLGNRARSFRDVLAVVRMSRILDDVTFRGVASRTDLVTRLLSDTPSPAAERCGVSPTRQQQQGQQAQQYRRNDGSPAGRPNRTRNTNRNSLTDSIRGFGNARHRAHVEYGLSGMGGGVPRYVLGKYSGRDGREYIGIDRLRL